MKKFLATIVMVSGLVLTMHGTTHAADPYHYSEWHRLVWPFLGSAYAQGVVWPTQGTPKEIDAYWFDRSDPWGLTMTWPSDTSAWFRVRARCTVNSNGSGASTTVTSHWVGPGQDTTGPSSIIWQGFNWCPNGTPCPPEAWVRCPPDKPYASLPQTQVASLYVTSFTYMD